MSNNLNLPQLTAQTANKEQFIDDLFALLDASITSTLQVDGSANGALQAATFQNVARLCAIKVPQAGTTITLSPIIKLLILANAKTSSGLVTFACGNSSISIPVGKSVIAYMDSTANGLDIVSAAGSNTLAALADVDESGGLADGQVLTFDQGSGKWKPQTPTGGSGGSYVPWNFRAPKAASFPNTVGDVADLGSHLTVLDDADIGFCMAILGASSGNHLIARTKQINNVNTAWSVRWRMKVNGSAQNYFTGGLMLTKLNAGDMTVFGCGSQGVPGIFQFNSAGTNYDKTTRSAPGYVCYDYYRVDFDGNDTLTFYHSNDGKQFVNFAGEVYSAASLCGGPPDTIGFGLIPNYNNAGLSLSVSYYTDNIQ